MKRKRFLPPEFAIRNLLIGHWSLVIFSISLALLSIPALQPLLTNDFTCGYDNVLHLWRALETDALLDHGFIYSRWQPHMALGFGYPTLLFNPPISPLLAALFHRLGLAWPAAVNATFVTGTLLSAWTVWLLVREWWGDLAGVVAGVIITTIPFHAYVNFRRASMSEALAWAFPALILWGLIRWQKYGQRRGLLAAAGGEAALLLTHDASAYLFFPLPLVTIVALALAHRHSPPRKESWEGCPPPRKGEWEGCPPPRRGGWGGLGRGILALALGVGMAAFFWLPSVLERPYVQFDRVLDYPYAASFVALDYLLEPPRAADPTLINPWLPKGVGLLPAMLVLLSPLAWLRASRVCPEPRRREQRFWLAAVGIVTLGYVWLTLPYARSVWRSIPLLHYLHFPWRFLTPAAVGVAILGGAATYHVSRFTFHVSRLTFDVSHFVPLVIIGALTIGSLGWLYPPHCDLSQPATLPGMLAYERTTGELGGTYFSELLPVWVRTMPSEHVLDDDLNAGREPVRLRPEMLPEGARVLQADYGPVEATIELDTPVPFRARYMAFYYPGWRATVDGNPIPITPTDPDGLISFDVPAGRHTVCVRFGETPLRLLADAVSLLSLIVLLALIIHPPNLPSRPTQSATVHCSLPHCSLFILITAILLLVAKLALIDRFDTPLRRANLMDGHLRRVDVPTEITFGDEFILLGHDALPLQKGIPSGERLEVRTYWRALQPGGPDYGVTVNVVDTEGHRWNGSDIQPPRWHRTPPPVWEWPPEQYAIVALSVPLLSGTPPGTYTVEAVAFDRDTLAPLTAHDADGRALGPALSLGQIAVTAPRHPIPPLGGEQRGGLGIRHRFDAPLGPLTLLGADFDRDHAAPGDPILLTTFWHTKEQPTDDFVLHLALLAPDGSPAAEYDLPPTVPWHPTSAWQPGDTWRGQHLLHLPATLDSGDYTWHLTLISSSTPSPSTHLPSSLSITAPDRTFTPPPVDIETNTRLGNVATLLGATLAPSPWPLAPGTPLTVTLAWRAEAETHTSYHVFLHLIGPDGALVAQSDGVPADWTRPTTGWLPGEYVTDARVLALPAGALAGDYTLSAGLYVPGAERLTTPDGTGAVPLITITVEAQ